MAEKPLPLMAEDDVGTSPESNGDTWPDIHNLIADYHTDLYRYAYRLTGKQDESEDLTQQTFMIAHQKINQLRDPLLARSWLFTVLRNCFLKIKRKQLPRTAASIEVDVNDIPETRLNEDNFDGELLQNALDQLPDEFRLVLVMFFFEGCSYKDIAEKLELPIGTVMSRLSRAKSHLRGKLTTADALMG